MEISVTIYIIHLKSRDCILRVILEGSMSQIFDLGHRFGFTLTNLAIVGTYCVCKACEGWAGGLLNLKLDMDCETDEERSSSHPS